MHRCEERHWMPSSRSGRISCRVGGLGLSWRSSGEEVPVATGPAGQTAAAPDDYGRMRTSHADREQAIDTLKAAYVQGRLTKGELDERLSRALVPLTHAELAALTDDLPDGLATAGRPCGADQDMTPLREGNRGEARV